MERAKVAQKVVENDLDGNRKEAKDGHRKEAKAKEEKAKVGEEKAKVGCTNSTYGAQMAVTT